MKTLQRVLVLSVAALVIFGALSANAQAAERRGGYSARAGAGQHGGNRVHRAPRARGLNRGGRDFYRGGRGYYWGGHRVWRHAGHRGYFYRGYVGCRPTFSFFYDSYGNRIRLIGSGCF